MPWEDYVDGDERIKICKGGGKTCLARLSPSATDEREAARLVCVLVVADSARVLTAFPLHFWQQYSIYIGIEVFVKHNVNE
jgi:uncharacterized cysteine cluster protein YcgN (CxxCxxCC family)